jgi:hypothetical protein
VGWTDVKTAWNKRRHAGSVGPPPALDEFLVSEMLAMQAKLEHDYAESYRNLDREPGESNLQDLFKRRRGESDEDD